MRVKHCAGASEKLCRLQMAAAHPMQQLQQLSAAQQRVKDYHSAKQRQLKQKISPRCSRGVSAKKVNQALLLQRT